MALSVEDQQKLRQAMLAALSSVPEIGAVLSAVFGLLWNPTANIWDEIKAEVEALIEQDLAKYDEQQVQEDLDGLQNVLQLYQTACAENDVATIRSQWEICRAFFVDQQPHFQTPGYELQLLLLFVQYANLYLVLLRDGVVFGASWGKNPQEIADTLATLNSSIQTFQAYVTTTIANAVAAKQAATGSDRHAVEPLRTVNAYSRLLTFNAADVAATWPYIVPGTPIPDPPFMRYVYADPIGTADDAGADIAIIPPVAPGQPISGVRVWADPSAIYATQLQYGGATLGPIHGHSECASILPPQGGSFAVSPDNPITGVSVAAGDHITGLQFQFKDGSLSQVFGNGNGLAPLDSYGELVGDVVVACGSVFYNLSASCLLVGYMPAAQS